MRCILASPEWDLIVWARSEKYARVFVCDHLAGIVVESVTMDKCLLFRTVRLLGRAYQSWYSAARKKCEH